MRKPHSITAFAGLLLTSLIPPAAAWDSPLPYLSQPSGSDVAAFGNPAAATRPGEAGTGFFLGHPDSADGPWKRDWIMHHQEDGQALGLRLREGGAKSVADFTWAAGHDVLGVATLGIRAGYLWREDARDRLRTDAGLQFRPHPAFLAGYWAENLYATGGADRIHRWSAGLKPFAGSGTAFGESSVGYGMDIPEEGRRAEYAFLQVGLPLGISVHSRWEFKREAGAVGIAYQATPQAVLAWGLRGPYGNLSEWNRPRHREAGVRFHKAAKPMGRAAAAGSPRVAELDLNRAIVEGESPRTWLGPTGELGHLDLLRDLDVIEADPRVKGVVLKLGRARSGWGIAEEARGRILRLRSRGKRVVAYMEQATPLNYYLASAADCVAVQPGGHFAVNGFSSETMFYRGFFDKVGVEPQFLRHGKYKSFEEPFTRKEMSPEARANLESYLGSLWGHFLETVSASRRISRDSLARVLAAGEIGLAQARAAGLIDTLVHDDEVHRLAGGPRAVKAGDPAEGLRRGNWEIPPRIAVVLVQGDMVMGESSKGWLGSPELAGAESVAAQLRRARKDPRVEAVVLRVESPGGSAQAADIMAREVDLLRKEGKPVVASIGHMAASGGYYLVCGADLIYSAHNSAVGSIGILWGKFVLKGLHGKLGLTTETVKTTPHADANSSSRPWDSSEVAVLQRHMDDFYDRFLSRVAAGRKISKAKADSLAQGRIFTGTQSVAAGLVDRIGGLEDAVAEAARLAGIPADRHVELEPIAGGQGRSRLGGGWAFLATPEDLGQAGLQAAGAWAGRWRDRAEGQLWAMSPELSGWSGALLE